MYRRSARLLLKDGRFQVPDFRSRMPVGFDPNSLNSQGTDWFNVLGKCEHGEVKHQLTPGEMPKHRHTIQPRVARNGGTSGGVNLPQWYGPAGQYATQETESLPAGDDGWHNNMPPYMTINYIIRAK